MSHVYTQTHQEELKALRLQMRGLGWGITMTLPGLGTVTVGEATVGAKQYRNKVPLMFGSGHSDSSIHPLD